MTSVLGSHSQKGPITLTLVKFSHCTVATPGSSTSGWKHLSGQNNLFLVFDSIRRLDVSEQIVSKDVLKVAYQQELLEDVELDSLRLQARSDASNLAQSERMTLSFIRPGTLSVSLRYRLADNRTRKLQGTFLNKMAYDTCIGIFETYEIPLVRKTLTTRPASMSIPSAAPFEFSSPCPRPASAQDIMSRPVVALPGHPNSQTKRFNRQTSNDSQPAAIIARSTLSQVWQPTDSQSQPSNQQASLSRHTTTSQPARSNLPRLWQPDEPQPQKSSQNASSSRHTPTSQPVWIPSSPPSAHLSQVWQAGDPQPGIPSQRASSSRHASESQRIWVPSTIHPPMRLSQGSDKGFRNCQRGSRTAIDVPLAHECSMVMDSMASSQASDGLNTQYPPPSSQLKYLPTSDLGINSDATMIQSPEMKASERQLEGAHGTPDTPQLPFPIESFDRLNKSAPSFTINELPTSESYQPNIPPEEISEGLVANFPVAKDTNQKPSEPVRTASEVEPARDVTEKGQGDQTRASPATRSKKARPVSKRTRAATQATKRTGAATQPTGADPSASKIVVLKIGKIERNSNHLEPSSAPPVVPLKRSGTYLDDASTTGVSSSHSSPTLPPKPAPVRDSGNRPEETQLQDVLGNSQSSKSQISVNGQLEANAGDHNEAAHSLKDIHRSLDAFLSKNHQLLAPDPPPSPFSTFKEQMAHFGALPKEERTKVVDKMIMEALMDPDFHKLCHEVEQSWKRFAFEV